MLIAGLLISSALSSSTGFRPLQLWKAASTQNTATVQAHINAVPHKRSHEASANATIVSVANDVSRTQVNSKKAVIPATATSMMKADEVQQKNASSTSTTTLVLPNFAKLRTSHKVFAADERDYPDIGRDSLPQLSIEDVATVHELHEKNHEKFDDNSLVHHELKHIQPSFMDGEIFSQESSLSIPASWPARVNFSKENKDQRLSTALEKVRKLYQGHTDSSVESKQPSAQGMMNAPAVAPLEIAREEFPSTAIQSLIPNGTQEPDKLVSPKALLDSAIPSARPLQKSVRPENIPVQLDENVSPEIVVTVEHAHQPQQDVETTPFLQPDSEGGGVSFPRARHCK